MGHFRQFLDTAMSSLICANVSPRTAVFWHNNKTMTSYNPCIGRDKVLENEFSGWHN